MADNVPDPATVAELDQVRAGVDRLADLLIHLDRRLSETFCEPRRIEIIDRWLTHQLGGESND